MKLIKSMFHVVTLLVSFAGISNSATIIVARDGSGDYNCDGIDDHVEINQAIQAIDAQRDTVYLESGTYLIGSPSIYLNKFNMTLTGDSTAVIKLKDHAQWPQSLPLFVIEYAYDVTICGFEIDGNDVNNIDFDGSEPPSGRIREKGYDYYDLIAIKNSKNIRINNMYLHNNLSDGIFAIYSDSIFIYNNKIINSGRDGIDTRGSNNIMIYDNIIQATTNM